MDKSECMWVDEREVAETIRMQGVEVKKMQQVKYLSYRTSWEQPGMDVIEIKKENEMVWTHKEHG